VLALLPYLYRTVQGIKILSLVLALFLSLILTMILTLFRWSFLSWFTATQVSALTVRNRGLYNRRALIRTTASGLLPFVLLPSTEPCFAGEIGAKITSAVTTSDLGISVRRSVVK